MTPIPLKSGADRALVPTASSPSVSTKGFDHGELERLAERCEAATGPDRELDHAIHAASFGNAGYCGNEGWLCAACSAPAHELTQEPGCGAPMGLSDERTSYPNDWRDDERLGRYTASLDAATATAPENNDAQAVFWRLGNDGEGGNPGDFKAEVLIASTYTAKEFVGLADTAPLAFCAATLRAKAAV